MKLTWKAYNDGERIIIGAEEWQGKGYSQTDGVFAIWNGGDVKSAIEEASSLSLEECNSKRRVFETPERFESACDAGIYGVSWE